jgi:hypothetical protein
VPVETGSVCVAPGRFAAILRHETVRWRFFSEVIVEVAAAAIIFLLVPLRRSDLKGKMAMTAEDKRSENCQGEIRKGAWATNKGPNIVTRLFSLAHVSFHRLVRPAFPAFVVF